jgi:hypothetical protein
MTHTDVEVIVRSVIRQYGVGCDVRGVTLAGERWRIDVVSHSGEGRTFTVLDSPPQHLRRSVMSALDIDG